MESSCWQPLKHLRRLLSGTSGTSGTAKLISQRSKHKWCLKNGSVSVNNMSRCHPILWLKTYNELQWQNSNYKITLYHTFQSWDLSKLTKSGLNRRDEYSKIEWWLDWVFPFLYHYSLLVFQSWLLNQKNVTCATQRTKGLRSGN